MIQNWLLAIRPKTLFVAASPVLVGSAVAINNGSFSGIIFLLCLFGSLLLQIESNLANDYFDWKHGSDTKERLGPVRVTSSGLITPKQMVWGMAIVAILSVAVGITLIALAGLPILWIGSAGLLCAFLYTAGPYPLSRIGIADLFVFIFFGPVAVIGTTYAHSGHVQSESILYSLPIGFVATAILLVNNIRDHKEDSLTGKKTLVVKICVERAIKLYQLLIMTPVFASLASGFIISTYLFLPLLAVPLMIKLQRSIRVQTGKGLNSVLAMTGLYLFLTSLLLAVGIVL